MGFISAVVETVPDRDLQYSYLVKIFVSLRSTVSHHHNIHFIRQYAKKGHVPNRIISLFISQNHTVQQSIGT